MSDRIIRACPTPETAGTLALRLKPGTLPRFFPLCQQGFLVKVPGSGSVRTILCRYLGLSPEYLEGRIQTIFLNGKPVDELDAAMVGPGDTLALSAALPGLVGATMRRGGSLAGLRANISYGEQVQTAAGGECLVQFKLFNLVTGELAPLLLEQGIWIKAAVLESFLRHQPEDFWTGFLEASLNGEGMDLRALPAIAWPQGEALVHLQVMVG
jgi:hypothetical protein